MAEATENYGQATTGRPSFGKNDFRRHAVPLPWRPGHAKGKAVCGKEAFLTWVFGLPMAYSLRDGSLCEACEKQFL